uniref:Uncharacterized protein n=1 Tax=Oryza glaberrima TaxID=4538 RepID=I1Q9P6_ORYGL
MAPTVPPAFSTAATTTSPGRPPRHHLAMPGSMPAAATQHRAGGGGARGERVSVRSSNRVATSPCRSPHHVVLEEEKGRGARSLGREVAAVTATSPRLPLRRPPPHPRCREERKARGARLL